MRTILITGIFCVFANILFAYNSLRIIDPQQGSWRTYPVKIDSAEMTVKNLGAYSEHNLFLTFSPYNSDAFNANTQLEIILDFELPYNSFITDSWLWIEGEPKQAEIMDRWTASNIYEQIVNRRKDPSLLVKTGNNQYTLNIYPLKPFEARKVKITYLTPNRFYGDEIKVEIPDNILNQSSYAADFKVYFQEKDSSFPVRFTDETITLETINHPEFGNCTMVILNYSTMLSPIFLTPPANNTLVTSIYGSDDEGFYQLAIKPSDWIEDIKTGNRICYIVDYEEEYYNSNSTAILQKIKSNIGNTLTDGDEFNVLFSNLQLTQAFDQWMSASSENLEIAFTKKKLTTYSNLVPLLAKAIMYINDQEEEGEIVIISNNSSFNDLTKTNKILSDINGLNSSKIPISVIDYSNTNRNYYWIQGFSYTGSGYLFSNLTRSNGGEFIQFNYDQDYSNFDYFLSSAFEEVIQGLLSNIDIYTKCTNGFSYGRINISSGISNRYKTNRTIYQLGKYKGGIPSQVEISLESNNQVYHTEIQLNQESITAADSTLQTIWHGLDILQLEQQFSNSQIINEIIFSSLENRILSNYTAFLCLEDSISVCEDCNDFDTDPDDVVIVGVDESAVAGIGVYPNPFNTMLNINLEDSEDLLELKVYNMMGKCVKTFVCSESSSSFVWDGSNEFGQQQQKGLYLIVASYRSKRIIAKVLKI